MNSKYKRKSCFSLPAAVLLLTLFSGSIFPLIQAREAEQLTPMLLMHNLDVRRFSGRPIMIEFNQTDIRLILKFIEKTAGFVFDIEPGISGEVSYHFGTIPWDEALSRILLDRRLNIDLGFEGIKIHTRKTQSLVITDSSRIKLLIFFRRYFFVILAVLILIFGGLLFGLVKKSKLLLIHNHNSINGSEKNRKRLMDEERAEDIKQKVMELLKMDRLYKNPDISLQSIASRLDITVHQLSWVINEKFSKSFANFVNEFRIEEVKRLLEDGTNNHRSILDIAFDSGFNTKTAFNRVFKKHTGMTPSEFRKKNNPALQKRIRTGTSIKS